MHLKKEKQAENFTKKIAWFSLPRFFIFLPYTYLNNYINVSILYLYTLKHLNNQQIN